jgi:hypothetical protein
MNEAREEIDRLLEAGRPLSDVEERIDQLLIGKEAKATLWLRRMPENAGKTRAGGGLEIPPAGW